MANNRMYLRCKGCGGCILISMRWGDEWQVWHHTADSLGLSFFWHHGCVPVRGEHGPGDFELIYETNEDFAAKYRNWLEDLKEVDCDES